MFLYDKFKNEEEKKDVDYLWELLRCGNKEALGQLFLHFYTPLFNYGIKITSDEEVVKDGIQELFLRLWKRYFSLDQAKSVETYLLFSLRRILLRQIKNHKKKLERNKEYLDDVFSSSFSIEELMIRKELKEEQKKEVVNAINHLNNRQKETLFLRYSHGLTNSEIAEIMGINEQSVRNNLSRAIKNLKMIVEPDSFLK